MSRPSSAAARRRAPTLAEAAPSLFEPAPLQKSKSALTLRVRGQLSHLKGMANMVSQGLLRGEGALTLEDLTTGQLLLDRDSEVTISKAAGEREREMRDIVDRRQIKYNRDRLVSDTKEDALSKMCVLHGRALLGS